MAVAESAVLGMSLARLLIRDDTSVSSWEGRDAGLPFAPRLGLGPGRNLGQGGIDVTLVKIPGDGLGLAAHQHGRQPMLDLIQGPGQRIAFGCVVELQPFILRDGGVAVVVVGVYRKAVEAEQFLVLARDRVAVDVDAKALVPAGEQTVLQPKGHHTRLNELLGTSDFASHLCVHCLLRHVVHLQREQGINVRATVPTSAATGRTPKAFSFMGVCPQGVCWRESQGFFLCMPQKARL
jgi:hypothetical protein